MIEEMLDVFGDPHVDEIEEWKAKAFVEKIIPKNPSSIMCFKGDFSYNNEQTLEFLNELTKHYEYVLFVLGNNDVKIYDKHPEGYRDAFERVMRLKKDLRSIPRAIHLDGKTFTHRGITYGGSDIFYDFQSVQNQFDMSEEEVLKEWHRRRLHVRHKGWIIDPVAHAEKQKEQLRSLIPLSDVIITHGPPNYFVTPDDQTMGFFRFDATEHIQNISGKTWLFGHQHQRRDEIRYGCRFVNAAYAECGEGVMQIQVLKDAIQERSA